MKIVGLVMLIFAALGFFVGFNIDTTVATGHGTERVHNLGLMNDKQSTLLVAAALAVVGALFRAVPGSRQAATPSRDSSADDTRMCPYCAESIKSAAVICRYCSREVTPDAAASGSYLPQITIKLIPDPETMAKHGITFDGERYHYREYRYDKYGDALEYAKLQASIKALT